MKILSFDTSTKNTGYAVFNDEQLVHYSSIDRSDMKNTDERMKEMTTEILTVIDTTHPDIVVVEETVVPRNPQTQRMLTMILGVIYGHCICKKIHYCSLRPTQWRKLAKSNDEKLPRKRDELKFWSVARAKELFGVDGVDDNITDAILVGYAYSHLT